MRIAYLDPHPVPDDVPEALQILYTVDALGTLGAAVTLVTPKPRGHSNARDILGRDLCARVSLQHLPDPRKRWWFPSASNRPFYFMAERALRRLDADVVLVRNLKMAEYLLRRSPGLPLLFETHEVFAQTYREEHPQPSARERKKHAALQQREDFVYRQAAGLLTLTPLLLDDIRNTYGIDTPAQVVPDGVDLEQVGEATASGAPGAPILLYLGSLHPWKGVNTLIEMMRHVAPPARLVIVGGDAPRIAELRSQAERIGVAARVDLVGAVAPGRRFEWIHKADICLLPLTASSIGSRYTSPLKLFEYMGAGKAIVVSDLPSMRAVLTPDVNTLMVPTGEAPAFAAAVNKLLADRVLVQRLSMAARERVRDFTWVKRAENILAFIGSTIQPGNPDMSKMRVRLK